MRKIRRSSLCQEGSAFFFKFVKYSRNTKKILVEFSASLRLAYSKWLVYTFNQHIDLIERKNTRYSRGERMLYVVKKDGTREIFNVEKIVNAVNKSAARILYKF